MFAELSPSQSLALICALYLQFAVSLRYLRTWQGIFIFGLLLRLVFLPVPTALTSDIFRYLWEGHVLRNGINPYVTAPDSLALLPLHTEYWGKIQHAHLTAIYPPLAQALFTLFAFSQWSWRLLLILLDCVNFFLLRSLFRKKNIAERQLSWYWLIPLTIIEIAWSGHLDGLLVLFFLCLWHLRERGPAGKGRSACTGSLLAAACMIKYTAAFLFPFFFFRLLRISLLSALVFSATFAAGCLLFLAPFLDSDWHVFHSLGTYLEHWRFNDSLFHLIGFLCVVDWHRSETFIWIKAALTAFWMSGTLLISAYFRHLPVVATCVFLSYLLQSAVVHPWYLLWLLPFAVSLRLRAPLVFCLTAPLSYWPEVTTAIDLPVWIKLLEYVPVYACLIRDMQLLRSSEPTLHRD